MILGDSPEMPRICRIPLGPYGNNAYLVGDGRQLLFLLCYGPEFTAKAVREWLGRQEVKTLT